MAVTRKLLKGMGLTDEQVDTIIEAHTETVDGLKDQVKTYKADADKLAEVEKELNDLKKGDGTDYKAKYEAEKKAFADYKADNAAKETAAQIRTAYRALLKEAGIDEKRLDTVLKASDLTQMKLGEDGKLEGAEELTKTAKSEWADFIPVTRTEGAKVDNPPGNTGGKYGSKDEIMKIKDAGERQKAIAANLNLFQANR